MKIDDISNATPQLQTINECVRALPEMNPAHSIGKPGVLTTTTHINVRFVPLSLIQLQIKTKNPMKTASIQNKNKSKVPSPHQIAALREEFARPSISEGAPSLSRTPFADLMLHPEKLEVALKTARRQNDAFDASRTFGRGAGNGARKSSGRWRSELKTIEFHFEAPWAASVKLAADFTDWEKFPLDMIKAEDGVWSIFVPLAPGNYSYRFIADGEWRDDPHAELHEPNPFGAANAVVEVT